MLMWQIHHSNKSATTSIILARTKLISVIVKVPNLCRGDHRVCLHVQHLAQGLRQPNRQRSQEGISQQSREGIKNG